MPQIKSYIDLNVHDVSVCDDDTVGWRLVLTRATWKQISN